MRSTLILCALMGMLALAAAGGYEADRRSRPHAAPPRKCRVCDKSWDYRYPVVKTRSGEIFKDFVRGDFVEEAFQIVVGALRKEANKKHCDFVKVDRIAACYESIKERNDRQCIGAYGFEFGLMAVCPPKHAAGRPSATWFNCKAETLNRRHAPHLVIGEIECEW